MPDNEEKTNNFVRQKEVLLKFILGLYKVFWKFVSLWISGKKNIKVLK